MAQPEGDSARARVTEGAPGAGLGRLWARRRGAWSREATDRGGLSTRLFLLSFLMLFVELALIRWTGSNVVYLGYFSNFVLLGSFLGIGIGFLLAGRRVDLFPWASAGLALLIAFVSIFPVKIDRYGDELIYFGEYTRSGLPIWATLPVIFLAVASVMAMIAQGVARTFVRFSPLEAYRLDILGSLAGVVAFTLLSFAGAPPVAWGVLVALIFLFLYGRVGLVGWATLMVLVAFLAAESASPNDSWSPYYKITVTQGTGSLGRPILVNGIPHQVIEETEARRALEPIYFLPYERVAGRSLDDVLIIGAGNGTDVAIALVQGAHHVDAVEIDPRLIEIGREEHPNRPYDDPRVETHVGDGRAFLEQTDRRYDLILFALPDSLTLVSGQSSLRLESYLFTQESIENAREKLKPGGTFGMYNFYRQQWLIDRLARTLEVAYGRPPCQDVVHQGSGLALMMASDQALPCQSLAQTAGAPDPVHDDRPFLYLRTASVPGFYLLTIGLILLVSLVAVRVAAGPLRAMSGYLDLFFMGAAFLLLETKNIVQFALLFGTTWLVNALVFAGILVAVLAAIEVSRRVEIARPVRLYWLLLLSLVVAWVVPASFLLDQPFVLRFPLAVALAFTPIFLANLIFAQRFKNVAASNIAFGANLLGAMVGGLIEYSSLVIGYNSLLIVVAVVYGLALLSGRRYLRPAPRLSGP